MVVLCLTFWRAVIHFSKGRWWYWSKGTKFQLCKMNNIWRSNIHHGNNSLQYCIVYLIFAKFPMCVCVCVWRKLNLNSILSKVVKFAVFLLLLISKFLPLWLEKKVCRCFVWFQHLKIYLDLFCGLLCGPFWRLVHVHLKKCVIFCYGWMTDLWMSVRIIWVYIVAKKLYFLIDFLSRYSTIYWKWSIEVSKICRRLFFPSNQYLFHIFWCTDCLRCVWFSLLYLLDKFTLLSLHKILLFSCNSFWLKVYFV